MLKKLLLAGLFSLGLITYNLCLYAQSTADLDAKYGFNKYLLNSTVADVKKVTALKKVSSSRKTFDETYAIRDLKNFDLFGHAIESIHLSFYKDRLWQIEVKLPDAESLSPQAQANSSIGLEVKKRYGLNTSVDTSYQTKTYKKRMEEVWSGSIVTLVRYWNLTTTVGFRLIKPGDRWFFIENSIANRRTKELSIGSDAL